MLSSILLSAFLALGNPSDTSFHSSLEIKALASDLGTTPFWLRSLQYGTMPLENPGAVGIIRHGKNSDFSKKYDWNYRVEAVGWAGQKSDFFLSEAFVSGRRGKWELWAGRKKEIYGLGDSTLSGGFYAWSGNALPMPKVQVGTRDYLNFFKNWFGIHMTFAHGWFDNQGPVLNAMLHQKTLFGRIGKPNSLFSFYGGLNHFVSWGGESKVKTGGEYDYYPSSLNAYFYVVTLLKDRSIVAVDTLTTYDDAGNQYGNHLGSVDFALKFQPAWAEVLIYKQTAYETGRLFSLTTADDGISGISIKLKKRGFIEAITFEYVYTANQGRYVSGIGRYFGLKDPHLSELEGYFNNGGRGGWNYMGKGIGTPLMIIDNESAQGGGVNFSRNANESFYLGIRGSFPNQLFWQIRASQSYHGYILGSAWYNQYVSYIPQFSAALSLGKQVGDNLSFQAQIGYDQGERIKNTLGMNLGFKYQFH